MAIAIDPNVIALGTALSEGYTSLAAKQRMEEHSASGRYAAKARRRANRKSAQVAKQKQGLRDDAARKRWL